MIGEYISIFLFFFLLIGFTWNIVLCLAMFVLGGILTDKPSITQQRVCIKQLFLSVLLFKYLHMYIIYISAFILMIKNNKESNRKRKLTSYKDECFLDNFWLFDPSLQVPSQSLLRNIFLKVTGGRTLFIRRWWEQAIRWGDCQLW